MTSQHQERSNVIKSGELKLIYKTITVLYLAAAFLKSYNTVHVKLSWQLQECLFPVCTGIYMETLAHVDVAKMVRK